MRARDNPPDTAPPDYLDYEMWTGPAPMRPYNPLVHPRGWRAFMEYGNGIVGDMCIHMLDMVRWMLDLGWPKRIASTGGILVDKESKANIPDTQTATFDFGDLTVVWQHRTWGEPADPKYPWGATFYGDKGTLKVSVNSYDFIPLGGGKPIHSDVAYELEQYPEDKTEKDLERHVAPAIRGHMHDFLRRDRLARQAGGRHRARPHLDGELHPGQPGAAARPVADLGRREGRGRGRRGGEQAPAPALPRAVGPSRPPCACDPPDARAARVRGRLHPQHSLTFAELIHEADSLPGQSDPLAASGSIPGRTWRSSTRPPGTTRRRRRCCCSTGRPSRIPNTSATSGWPPAATATTSSGSRDQPVLGPSVEGFDGATIQDPADHQDGRLVLRHLRLPALSVRAVLDSRRQGPVRHAALPARVPALPPHQRHADRAGDDARTSRPGSGRAGSPIRCSTTATPSSSPRRSAASSS